MVLCQKCHVSEATMQLIRKVDGKEKFNVFLCEDCARPAMLRREASQQGQKQCQICGGAAFYLVPGVRKIIYACCDCRAEYARILFELCSAQRPELLQRSKRDIFFFDESYDPEVEDWADVTGQQALQTLRDSKPHDSCRQDS